MKWLIQLLSGPVSFLILSSYSDFAPENPSVSLMAGITVWMACWWITEVVDLAITSLLPLILLPVFGILDAKTTAAHYNDQVIFLFVGGFILSFAIEKWELHKRISLKILSLIGSSPVKILAGVMLTTYFTSMWVSNTATVMMLLSAVVAINYTIQQHLEGTKNKIATALLLGLAYSASIGGMATLVGTPTNMIFYSFYQTNLPDADLQITFTKWFAIAFPISLVLVIGTFFVLRFKFITKKTNIKFDKGYFKEAYAKLGPAGYEEKVVALIFTLTALLWFTRSDMNLGNLKFKGWNNFFVHKDYIQDSSVAIMMAILLFIIPSKKKPGQHLLMWEDAKKIPYDIILLFGSGFALAKGFEASGLSVWLAARLQFLEGIPLFAMIFCVCAVVCIISEFASNVASIQLVLPILLVLSKGLHLNPLILMIPATLAASLGYILPVATAPNTIVYGTKLFPVKHMLKTGAVIDILGIILIGIGIALYF